MPMNVLVVDDSAVVRSIIIKTLRLSGLPLGEVHQAANGLEGLDALTQHPVDLILVDINMPVMDGEEMIRQVRARSEWGGIPIVVVSTEGSETRIDRLQQSGARFIHKPFGVETVREVVREILKVPT